MIHVGARGLLPGCLSAVIRSKTAVLMTSDHCVRVTETAWPREVGSADDAWTSAGSIQSLLSANKLAHLQFSVRACSNVLKQPSHVTQPLLNKQHKCQSKCLVSVWAWTVNALCTPLCPTSEPHGLEPHNTRKDPRSACCRRRVASSALLHTLILCVATPAALSCQVLDDRCRFPGWSPDGIARQRGNAVEREDIRHHSLTLDDISLVHQQRSTQRLLSQRTWPHLLGDTKGC